MVGAAQEDDLLDPEHVGGSQRALGCPVRGAPIGQHADPDLVSAAGMTSHGAAGSERLVVGVSRHDQDPHVVTSTSGMDSAGSSACERDATWKNHRCAADVVR